MWQASKYSVVELQWTWPSVEWAERHCSASLLMKSLAVEWSTDNHNMGKTKVIH